MNPEEFVSEVSKRSKATYSDIELVPRMKEIHQYLASLASKLDNQNTSNTLTVSSNGFYTIVGVSFSGNEITFNRTDDSINVIFKSSNANAFPFQSDTLTIINNELVSSTTLLTSVDNILKEYLPFLLS